MDKIIIAVDLGHFKAYKVEKTPLGGSKISMIENYDSIETHGKVSEKVSDASGRFGMGGGKNGAATGTSEAHNTQLESEKRLIKLIAKSISSLLSREKVDSWHFAAPSEINGRIIENLNPDIKARLGKNISCNLTKSAKAEILDHFA
jgi:hypothetical protein